MSRSSSVLVLAFFTTALAPVSGIPANTSFEVSVDTRVEGTTADGEMAYQYLIDLTRIGSRTVDAPTHLQAQEYLISSLKEMGYSPEIQPFKTKDHKEAVNIIAEKAGLSEKKLIVGGHYDMVPEGDGVDDNGSGIAVILEAARRVAQIETPYTIQFIFFDAEESGLQGSSFFAGSMSRVEIRNTVAMINLDSLAVGDYTYIYGNQGKDGRIRDWALDYARENGLALITQSGKNPEYPAGTTVDASDHAPFLKRGMQYAYFEATNWDLGELDGYTQVDETLGDHGEIWHTRFDTLDYIETTFPGRLQEHLSLFSHMLMKILTDYQEPGQS